MHKSGLVWALGAVIVSSLPALADGVPETYGEAPIAPVYNWSGFYIGAHGGYADASVDWRFKNNSFYNDAEGDRFGNDPEGAIYGGHVGVNHQWGNIVVGAEVSYSGADLDEDSRSPFFPDEDTLTSEIDAIFTATGRLGYAHGPWLGYVKGGYAAAEVEIEADTDPSVNGNGDDGKFSADNWNGGWTIGGGIEWMVHRNVVIGVEYAHIDLGDEDFNGEAEDNNGPVRIEADTEIDTVTARVSFKFDRERAAPAPLK